MPVTPTYPGVYVEEIPSGVRTITGVSTSVTAFIGVASRGPTDKAVRILSFTDYEDVFGGLEENSMMSYAVQHFFLNGGGEALVIRVVSSDPSEPATKSSLNLFSTSADGMVLEAASEGTWGNNLKALVNFETRDKAFKRSSARTTADATESAAITAGKALESIEKTIAANKVFAGLSNSTEEEKKKKAEAEATWKRLEVESEKLCDASKKAFEKVLAEAEAAKEAASEIGVVVIKSATEAAAKEATKAADELNGAIAKAKAGEIAAAETALAAAKSVVDAAKDKADEADRAAPAKLFNLTVQEHQKTENLLGGIETKITRSENFKNLPFPTSDSEAKELEGKLESSSLIRYRSGWALPEGGIEPITATGGANGALPAPKDAIKNLDHLDKVDLFNLLCIPPFERGKDLVGDDSGNALLANALVKCEDNRAILLIDAPSAWSEVKTAHDNLDKFDQFRHRNAACYFPDVKISDPLKDGVLQNFPPCGVVAGMIARTDVTRGVWKAPAGQDDGKLRGVQELATKMSDGENGLLNPLGINCLRSFPVIGNVAWGARTLVGADLLANEWKYLPVRRLALFLEESLYRGTHWAVFEPNDEPLWAQLRLNVGAFMQNLFRQGAFQGQSPKEAYLVKVDKETTTQNDVNQGIVNIHVGFAPLKPAEFVILKFQQLAGQIDT